MMPMVMRRFLPLKTMLSKLHLRMWVQAYPGLILLFPLQLGQIGMWNMLLENHNHHRRLFSERPETLKLLSPLLLWCLENDGFYSVATIFLWCGPASPKAQLLNTANRGNQKNLWGLLFRPSQKEFYQLQLAVHQIMLGTFQGDIYLIMHDMSMR